MLVDITLVAKVGIFTSWKWASPGPEVNFQGVSQVGNYKLEGKEQGRAKSEESCGRSPQEVRAERQGRYWVFRKSRDLKFSGPLTPTVFSGCVIHSTTH